MSIQDDIRTVAGQISGLNEQQAFAALDRIEKHIAEKPKAIEGLSEAIKITGPYDWIHYPDHVAAAIEKCRCAAVRYQALTDGEEI